MSDVGLGASLELSITDALRRVDQLGTALDKAAAAVVQVDTSNVAPRISAAVDAADSAVVITADAADVTGSIDGAVQAADTHITVDGEVDSGLLSSTDQLGDSLDAAATSGIGLQGILAGISVAGVLAGLKGLASAASDLNESTSKAATVFGDSFGQIETFAEGAARSVGLSKQAALEATGTFGNLFQALGLGRQAAADLSPQVVQLAGDLASFNNLGTDVALEKLRSGLVGEIEPLRGLGVSFNAMNVEAKAAELGLGGVGRELTEGEKVQARYALILEQTTLAQGDFARTADGLANSQRTLSANIDNAAAKFGTALLPAFKAVVGVGGLLVGGLAEIPGPAIQAAAAIAALVAAIAVSNFIAGSAAFAAVGSAISAAGAAALVAAGQFAVAGGGTAGFAAALGALNLAALGPLAALAALGGAIVFYNKVIGDAEKEGKDFGKGLRASFDPATASLSELQDASKDLSGKITSLQGDVDDSFLGRNGVNRDFNAALHQGIKEAEDFKTEIDAAADAMVRATAEAKFGPLISQLTGTGEALNRLRDSAPEVGSKIAALRSGVAPTERAFLGLALGIGEAGLSEEAFGDAAVLLGTDVEGLKGFVEDATKAVSQFADTAIGALPTVADAFKNVGDDSVLSVKEFRKSLDDQATNMRAFTLRLTALTAAGFGDIAGEIAKQGPAVGGALAKELGDALGQGHTKILEQTRVSLDNFNGAWTDSTAFLRDTLGPEFVLTTGLIGSAATTTFGKNLNFGERLRIAGEVAALQMDKSGQAVAAIAATEGDLAATEYGKALKLDEKTVAAAVAAGAAIRNPAGLAADAAAGGSAVGAGFVQGFVSALDKSRFEAAFAAQGLTGAALIGARKLLGIQSPSKVMAEVGRQFAAGFALGITDGGSEVVAAAERITLAAAGGVAQVSPEVSLAAAGGSASAVVAATPAGDGLTQNIYTVDPIQAAAEAARRHRALRQALTLR